MKISEKWLRSWVDPDVHTDELCEQLTNLGLEVDSVSNPNKHIQNIVVAKIVDVNPLPESSSGVSSLSLCTVDSGGQQHQVVCGAPNAKAGLTTAYAMVGSVISDGTSISTSVIRGVPSEGMLCSPAELGINEDHSGILELSSDLTLGSSISDLLGFTDARTIDIDLTPNRGDCLSVRGIAREVGVINELEVNEVPENRIESTHDEELSIRLDEPQACSRYLGRIFKDVQPTQTPDWMVERLVGCGLKPIEPIVDITNYVMLELGQPLHAFDLKNVSRGIVVRNARSGEKLNMLDGREIEFDDESTLLITDGDTPLAIAGVMGGEVSGIQSDTRDVFLECAYFSPDSVMGTARRFGLQTDASHRYERGVDPELQTRAIERASELLLEITQGKPGPITVEESPSDIPTGRTISLSKEKLTKLIGEEISGDRVEDILIRLGFSVESSHDQWQIEVPPVRFDMSIEEDVVEEICRIYGYNQITPKQPSTALGFESNLPRTSPHTRVRSRVAELGYLEAINYSFIDPSINSQFGNSRIDLVNPMSEQLSSMRHSLIPGLLNAAKYNLSRQQDTVRLFELGKCFETREDKIIQPDRIGGVLIGYRSPLSWSSKPQLVDFFDAKGDVEAIVNLDSGRFECQGSEKTYLHPGESAKVLIEGEYIGDFGLLHPNISMDLELPPSTYVFELDVDLLTRSKVHSLSQIPPFPCVERDVSLLLDKSISFSQLIDLVEINMKDLLRSIKVFDLYEHEQTSQNASNIPVDQKSIGIRLELQDPNTTLTEGIVSERISSLVNVLSEEIGAVQR